MSSATLEGLTRFVDQFKAEFSRLPGAELPWLKLARQSAFAAFEKQGFPNSKWPGWRHTPAGALLGTEFNIADKPLPVSSFGGKALCPIDFHQLTIHNGRFLPDRSRIAGLPAGVEVSSLAEILRDDPDSIRAVLSVPQDCQGVPFADLAAAMFSDGVVVRISRLARLDRPLHVLLTNDDGPSKRPQSAHLRVMILLEEGASAEVVVESLGIGQTPFWTNLMTQVVLSEGSSLKHYRLQRESTTGVQTAATFVAVGRSARYESHAFNFGGTLVRQDLRVRLAGQGAESVLNGLALVRGSEIVDHHTVVEHACVGGVTKELYKAVLDERGRFVFDGLVDVRPGAQKTDASVYNKNLLLSEDADAHTNPEFVILADDVSCKHGGAIGRLSDESMFYLRSRGISAGDARRMLVYAFGSEMIDRVGLEPLKEALSAALHARMPEAAETII